MQITDQRPVINWQVFQCFSAFHPMHAGTCLGPWEGEKMNWIDLCRKNKSIGKILTVPAIKMLPKINSRKHAEFIGTLSTDCVFLPQKYSCGWVGVKYWEESVWNRGLKALGKLTLNRRVQFAGSVVPTNPLKSIQEQDTKPPHSPEALSLLSPPCSGLRGSNELNFAQGNNYRIISYYNYYRLLSHKDSPNYQMWSSLKYKGWLKCI